ncbi:uncharacterized protein M421DRAFT_426684 [Didymella exigua CBS 183.55]|uniref:Aminoglycoside phosphotransferase domain-containing protein n=1 Tax=Didymella exigua CBS 183.55 TaxID=1150837 RepID=A0A6A5R657_9PLEO|nr:uncharacterized protein M421DRAFT_426684 [Didymella exigua CBS 183.55]KAF1922668.1 hypothetical protein M421DRAFT_426684 [Didymella exigua CBS 183.55]
MDFGDKYVEIPVEVVSNTAPATSRTPAIFAIMSSPPQPPPNPLHWKFDVDEYLSQNKVCCDKAVSLDTGTSCLILRLDGLKDTEASANGHHEGQPAIMKCAFSTPKYQKFAVSPERLQFEVKALKSEAVAEACRQEPSVQVPRVLRETKNGFIMNHVGEMDLRTAFKTDASLDMVKIGVRLGRWLGSLHLAGIALGPDGWSSRHDELDKFYAPGGLAEKAIKASMSEEESEKVLAAMRAPTPTHTLTPWDFRPMNIVVRLPTAGEAPPNLTVVDWELCHYGDPSNDIRMWVAETMILEAKFGNRGLLSSFLSSYKQQAGTTLVNEEFVSKVALSAGIYMLWLIPINPRVWDCSEEDIEMWKAISLEYIRAGTNGNIAWLKMSCLAPLLE